MNEFLQVLVGLVFGAGAGYLYAAIEESRRRKPRANEARAALDDFAQLFDSLARPHEAKSLQEAAQLRDWRARQLLYCKQRLAIVATYITDDIVATHTHDELRIQIGAMPERAP